MRRGRSTGKPTKAQEARFLAIQMLGCIVCRKHKRIFRAAEIHHLTVGGRHGQKRRGHDYTIGLCGWHHRGANAFGNPDLGLKTYGPSYALHARQFRETYGSDDQLLAYQNELIERKAAA